MSGVRRPTKQSGRIQQKAERDKRHRRAKSTVSSKFRGVGAKSSDHSGHTKPTQRSTTTTTTTTGSTAPTTTTKAKRKHAIERKRLESPPSHNIHNPNDDFQSPHSFLSATSDAVSIGSNSSSSSISSSGRPTENGAVHASPAPRCVSVDGRWEIHPKHANVSYGKTDRVINSMYYHAYNRAEIDTAYRRMIVYPKVDKYQFRTRRDVPKVGVMIVGLAGNVGSALVGTLYALRHKLSWDTRTGTAEACLHGSVLHSSTVCVGRDENGQRVFAPLRCLLPHVDPSTIEVGGWDVTSKSLADSVAESGVFHPSLSAQLCSHLNSKRALKGIYKPEFAPPNLQGTADHILPLEYTHTEYVRAIQADISAFRRRHDLGTVVVVWCGSTERATAEHLAHGEFSSADKMHACIRNNHPAVRPSQLYAYASLAENCSFVHQCSNTHMVFQGLAEIARDRGVALVGSSMSTDETPLSAALTDHLATFGHRIDAFQAVHSIGNNHAKSRVLSRESIGPQTPSQLRQRRMQTPDTQSIDYAVDTNCGLYPVASVSGAQRRPDTASTLEYIPHNHSQRHSVYRYRASGCMGAEQHIDMVSESCDALSYVPYIIDTVVLTELATRISWKRATDEKDGNDASYQEFAPYLASVGMFSNHSQQSRLKALTHFLCACIGLTCDTDMRLPSHS